MLNSSNMTLIKEKGVCEDLYTVVEWKIELAELCKDYLPQDIYNIICVK